MSERLRQDAQLPPKPSPEWRLPSPADPATIQRLVCELSLPPALCGILAARGLTDPDAAKSFLRPRLESLHAPGRLKDLDVAVDRVLDALEAGETILVHGDYDVDGICAAALLTLWLRRLGGSVVPFVPHRLTDGYDLGAAGLRAALDARASLIITCDSGVAAHGAISEAGAHGLDVIVTDHHMPSASLPSAVAVVDPNRADCRYPAPQLCGAGVVFKLCQALGRRTGVPEQELWPHLDLVALATVADLVPLTGENRILVRFGLRYLAHTSKPGLRALMRAAGLESRSGVAAEQVGFVLGPRINAIGRMGDASLALQLLLTADGPEANRLAARLERVNERRREEDTTTLAQATERLALEFDPARDFGVVLAAEGWHPGVIGIVASRVVDRIHRPVVMVAMDGGRARGSARSIPGVHLLEAVSAGERHLVRFGGHAQAAGMEFEGRELEGFREAFNDNIRSQVKGKIPSPRLVADHQLSLGEANRDLHELVRHLGPFGIGNPRPVFWARALEVERPRTVGKAHLKLRLTDGAHELEAIGFDLARRIPPPSLGAGRFDAMFQLTENEYRGRRTLQAKLKDLRPAGRPASPRRPEAGVQRLQRAAPAGRGDPDRA